MTRPTRATLALGAGKWAGKPRGSGLKLICCLSATGIATNSLILCQLIFLSIIANVLFFPPSHDRVSSGGRRECVGMLIDYGEGRLG